MIETTFYSEFYFKISSASWIEEFFVVGYDEITEFAVTNRIFLILIVSSIQLFLVLQH